MNINPFKMKLVVFNFREWDESNRHFITEFKSHIPNRFKHLIDDIIKNPFGSTNIPAISRFMYSIDTIKSSSNDSDRYYISANLNTFINIFVIKEVKMIKTTTNLIPQFNLFHLGNICHLNVCINILSSLYYLIESLMNIKNIPPELDILRKYIINSLSPIDLNPKLILNLVRILDIDIKDMASVDDTIKKIMRLLYKVIKKNIIFYWDTSDEFIDDPNDAKLKVGDLIDKYNPIYLIVGSQDFNFITNINNGNIVPIEFDTPNNSKYVLTSVVISLPLHFVSAFRVNESYNFIIRDDMKHRFYDSYIDISNVKTLIMLSCYTRVK